MMTEKILDDVTKFWEAYRKEHDVDENIILTIIDTKITIEKTLVGVIELIVAEVARHREYEGKSVLEPDVKKEKDDDEDCPQSSFRGVG